MKLRYILPFVLLFVLSGCTDANTPSTYNAPVERKVVVPIEKQIEVQPTATQIKQKTDTIESQTVEKTENKGEVPLSNDNHYINTRGNEVHSPAYAPSVPPGASARCGDGTYSFSQSRRGTCSHHGGVEEWL
jgi:hypothetical protein